MSDIKTILLPGENCVHCGKPLKGEWYVEMAHRFSFIPNQGYLTIMVHLEPCSEKMRKTGWRMVHEANL